MNFVANAAVPSYLAYLAKRAGVRRMIYASSCSVYGYTVNELYDETAPVASSYPYGISKLQGEQGVLQAGDDELLGHRAPKGDDLRVQPANALRPHREHDVQDVRPGRKDQSSTTPSLWRPILDMRDAVSAYLRAIQADYSISGVFNIASDNYTVGQVGDMVKEEMERLLERRLEIEIKDIKDFRNYKVDDREGADRPRVRAEPGREGHDRGSPRASRRVRRPR